MDQPALRELILAAIEYQKVIRETIEDDGWDETGKVRMVARWRLQKAALEFPVEELTHGRAPEQP